MRGVAFAASAVLGLVLVLAVGLRPPGFLLRPLHVRPNFRGSPVAGTLGIVLVVPLAAGGAIALTAGARLRIVAAVVGAGLVYGAVGLVDDVYGDRHAGGLIGHARAMLHGRVTTGTVKAASGAVVGLAAAWLAGWRGAWVVAAGAVVALAAHLANLLDVRPGRALKVWLASFAALALTVGLTDAVLAAAGVAGGAAGFLEADLRERGMLGDAGAGLLGASLGAAAVGSVGRAGLVGCLIALAVLTATSETVSFTRVIERVTPLRFLDTLGRRT
jgi:UDP-N-acetylmuramyl pentapeptide phosphotransferase/UDP-N-acetylglucosamine-1-phosphate transferase